MLGLEWGLNNQGELRTTKDIPERGLPKFNLLGTTLTVSAEFLYHLHCHLLDVYFQSLFPSLLEKIQLKRRLLLLP